MAELVIEGLRAGVRGREILRALGVRPAPSTLRLVSERSFLGRERQVAELHDAFRATRDGQTVVAYVHGNSGMGKSTLVRIFLELPWT